MLSGGAIVRDGRGFGVNIDTTEGDEPEPMRSSALTSQVFEPTGGLTEEIGGTSYAKLLTVFDSGAFTEHVGFMFHNRVSAGGTFLVTVCAAATSPQFEDQVGDGDFFGDGTGTPGEDALSTPDPDGQQPDDPSFTDVRIGPPDALADDQNDVAWQHDLTQLIPTGAVFDSATLTLTVAGIEDGKSGADIDDRLLIEGIEVQNAFDAIDQGPLGTGVISFDLSASQLASFASDRTLDVEVDGGIDAMTGELESYYLDNSRLRIVTEAGAETVPVPLAPMVLLGLSMFAAGSRATLRQTPPKAADAPPV